MKIVLYPHPALRHACKPLPAIDKEVHLHAGRMLELMLEAQGLGLAAPQVGLTYQMFVLNLPALKPDAGPDEKPRLEGIEKSRVTNGYWLNDLSGATPSEAVSF